MESMAERSAKQQKQQRTGPAAFDALPPDCLQRVAELGFTSQVDPFWDRHDLLRQAATLACVGNDGCTELARLLFKHLSPRLGMELPLGVTERSTAKQLKEALKAWGLPTGGSKGDLWERLLDEVQDSMEDEEGNPPKHCIVSGATRRELEGWSSRRISQSKAKEVFGLHKWYLSKLQFTTDERKGSFGSKLYLLSDVKRLAWQAQPKGYGALRAQQDKWKGTWEKMKEDTQRKREEREAALRAELAQRGHSVSEVQAILTENPGLGRVMWGTMEDVPVAAAASHLERMKFCISGLDRREFFTLRFTFDDARPSKSLAKYKAREQRLERAAQATLRWFAARKSSLEQLQRDHSVPASLLPELEGYWRAAQAGATGPSGAGPSQPGAASQVHPSMQALIINLMNAGDGEMLGEDEMYFDDDDQDYL